MGRVWRQVKPQLGTLYEHFSCNVDRFQWGSLEDISDVWWYYLCGLLVQIWRNYDTDSSGYISATELKVTIWKEKNPLTLSVWLQRCMIHFFVFFQGFLQDLFLQHRKSISPDKLEAYTDTMVTAAQTPAAEHSPAVSDTVCPHRCRCSTKTKMADWT